MAGSSAITSATTKVFINNTLPSTYDNNATTGYPSLTGWIQIAEVSSVGAFGGKTTVVKHVPVDTATVVKRAGSVDYGTINLVMARHAGTDFSALTAAFGDRQSRSFKVQYPTALGVSSYFTGVVISNVTNVGTADKVLESQVDIELDSPVVDI